MEIRYNHFFFLQLELVLVLILELSICVSLHLGQCLVETASVNFPYPQQFESVERICLTTSRWNLPHATYGTSCVCLEVTESGEWECSDSSHWKKKYDRRSWPHWQGGVQVRYDWSRRQEICKVFATPMGLTKMAIEQGNLFPFTYLQRTGPGSRTLCVPSVSSSFQWDGKKVSTLAKSDGIIYILADSRLPEIDEVIQSFSLCSFSHSLHSNVVYSRNPPVMKNRSSQISV